MLFCNRHNGGQLTTTHFIFRYLSCVCFSTHFYKDDNDIFDDSHAGFSVLVENIFILYEHNDGIYRFGGDPKGCFDDKRMGLRILIWILMVINKYKDDMTFR